MSIYQHQIITAPRGQYTVADAPQMPKNRSRLVHGFLGNRDGKMDLSYLLQDLLPTVLEEALDQISGIAFYYNPRPRDAGDIAAGIENSKLLVFGAAFGHLLMHSIKYTGQRFSLDVGPPIDIGYIGASAVPYNDVQNHNVRTVQYEDELFIVKDDGLMPKRFFIDEFGTPHLYKLGMTAPAAPTHVSFAGGALTGNFRYKIVYKDERGRESSPSAYLSEAPVAQKPTIAFSWGTDPQVATVEVYRTLDSGTIIYYLVTEITDRTVTTYQDNATDLTIQANRQGPRPGQNDPPRRASICSIYKERLWLDDRSIYDDITNVGAVNTIQVSNLYNPTGFSSVSDPDSISDGTSLIIGSDPGDQVKAMFPFDQVMNVWKRRSRYQVYGDAPFTTADAEGFITKYVEAVGCQAADTVVRCGSLVPFLSEDGVRIIGYDDLGGHSRLISRQIDSYFTGFVPGTVFG